ncbi:12330_t:CDS:2, partial [Entrophospora sp. SA101]
ATIGIWEYKKSNNNLLIDEDKVVLRIAKGLSPCKEKHCLKQIINVTHSSPALCLSTMSS